MYSQHLQITDWLSLEGTSRDHLISPSCTDQSHQKHIFQDYVQLVLNISKAVNSVGSLGSPFQCLTTLTGNTFSLCLVLQISACAHCCLSFHWLLLKKVYFHLHLFTLCQVFMCSRYRSKRTNLHMPFHYIHIYTHILERAEVLILLMKRKQDLIIMSWRLLLLLSGRSQFFLVIFDEIIWRDSIMLEKQFFCLKTEK